MDRIEQFWHIPAMTSPATDIHAWQLYGEDAPFPDLLHIERIADRASDHHWRIDTHRHLQLHQVFLLLAGKITLKIEGTPWKVATPCLLNIPRMTAHSFAFSAGTEGWVLTLTAAEFPELFGPVSPASTALATAFSARPAEDLAASFAGLAAAHASAQPLRELHLRSHALSICLAAAEAAGAHATAPGPDEARLLRFEAEVRAHLTDGWQLPDYARRLGLSERHLRRLCLTHTGQSAHALIESVRLREACRLLAYTRMQVQEIGFSTGFDDPSYFARAFRRRMGLPPSAYRARLEG